jgi:hypothetical protein
VKKKIAAVAAAVAMVGLSACGSDSDEREVKVSVEGESVGDFLTPPGGFDYEVVGHPDLDEAVVEDVQCADGVTPGYHDCEVAVKNVYDVPRASVDIQVGFYGKDGVREDTGLWSESNVAPGEVVVIKFAHDNENVEPKILEVSISKPLK